MKKFAVLITAGIFLLILLSACSLKNKETAAEGTRTFVITDNSTGNVAATYDYDTETNQLKRTVVYDSEENPKRAVEYTFDAEGELDQQIISKPVGTELHTEVITYHTVKEYDAQGRLVKTIQTASNGQVIETFYGYDSTGNLRGVVQRNETGALMMKDY